MNFIPDMFFLNLISKRGGGSSSRTGKMSFIHFALSYKYLNIYVYLYTSIFIESGPLCPLMPPTPSMVSGSRFQPIQIFCDIRIFGAVVPEKKNIPHIHVHHIFFQFWGNLFYLAVFILVTFIFGLNWSNDSIAKKEIERLKVNDRTTGNR